MQWLRNLLGIKTPAEVRQAGRDYVDQCAQFCAAGAGVSTNHMEALWHQCDGAIDYGDFDRGMRDRLLELKIPHPLDTPDGY